MQCYRKLVEMKMGKLDNSPLIWVCDVTVTCWLNETFSDQGLSEQKGLQTNIQVLELVVTLNRHMQT